MNTITDIEVPEIVYSKLQEESAGQGLSVSDMVLILTVHVYEHIRFAQPMQLRGPMIDAEKLPKVESMGVTMARMMALTGALKCEECSQSIKTTDLEARRCAHCGADLHAMLGETTG